MNSRLLKACLAMLLTGSFLFALMFEASGADEKVIVTVKSLSVNILKVDATKEGQIVKLVGFLNSIKSLRASDLACYNGIDSSNPKSIAIESQGNNSYRVTCTMPVSKTDERGLLQASLGINADESHLGWQIVPMNAKYKIPNTFVDAFGIKRSENILSFTFERNPTFFATPLAVSPPSDYKVLPFEQGADGYLIFDSVDTEPLKPTVKFSKNKKNFSLNCPLPITKVSPKVKKQTMVAFWLNKALYKPRGILGSTFEPNYYNNLEISKSLKGKEVRIACATHYVLPESNVILAYSESAEISVKFPN
jgi:hypothetical protein